MFDKYVFFRKPTPLSIFSFLLKDIADLLDDQSDADVDTSVAEPTTSNTILFDEPPSMSEDVEMRETEAFSTGMRSKSTQTSFKPANVTLKSIKTQTIVDATSMFFQNTPTKPKTMTTSAKTQTSPDKASTMFSQTHDTISLPIVTDAIDIDVQSTAAREVDQKSTYAQSSSSGNLDSEDEFTTTKAEETSAEQRKL